MWIKYRISWSHGTDKWKYEIVDNKYKSYHRREELVKLILSCRGYIQDSDSFRGIQVRKASTHMVPEEVILRKIKETETALQNAKDKVITLEKMLPELAMDSIRAIKLERKVKCKRCKRGKQVGHGGRLFDCPYCKGTSKTKTYSLT